LVDPAEVIFETPRRTNHFFNVLLWLVVDARPCAQDSI
jgi:hypothetical protein